MAEIDLKLGPIEFRLLKTFMEKPARVWSREELLDRIWGRDVYVETRTVDVHIGRLRKELSRNGGADLNQDSTWCWLFARIEGNGTVRQN